VVAEFPPLSLNQKLTCANHGIYVATCVICHEQYIGQTKTYIVTFVELHRYFCYIVTFVEEPNSLYLDFCEDKWYHKLNAQINIQNMILPRVR